MTTSPLRDRGLLPGRMASIQWEASAHERIQRRRRPGSLVSPVRVSRPCVATPGTVLNPCAVAAYLAASAEVYRGSLGGRDERQHMGRIRER